MTRDLVVSCRNSGPSDPYVPRDGRLHAHGTGHGRPRRFLRVNVHRIGGWLPRLLFHHGLVRECCCSGTVTDLLALAQWRKRLLLPNCRTDRLDQTLSHKLRRQTFDDTLRQDLQFFDRPENNTGALASRVDSNPQSVFELMGFNIGLIIIAVLNVLVCSVLGIAHSWKLGLVIVFGGLPPLLASGWLKIRLDMKLDSLVSKRNSMSASIASEAITAIRTVSSLAIEERVLGRYTAELDHAVSGTVKPLVGVMVCFALTQAIEYWFMALGFWCVPEPRLKSVG